MTEITTFTPDSAIDRIFGPVIQARTWINMLYLLASFPLGVLYFVVLLPMICTGISLLTIFVGLFVLWASLLVSDVLSELDRSALNAMVAAGIPARPPAARVTGSVFRQMLATARRPGTVKRALYLLVRFPLGLVSFVLVMVLIPVSVGLLLAPLTYTFVPMMVANTQIESFDEAIYMCCFGAIFTLVSVHVLNSWTGVCRRFGQFMLG